MNTSEARTLINLERCEEISIHRLPDGWSVGITPERGMPQLHESTWLETKRGEVRLFASLDTAYGYVRSLGWDFPLRVV